MPGGSCHSGQAKVGVAWLRGRVEERDGVPSGMTPGVTWAPWVSVCLSENEERVVRWFLRSLLHAA